MKANLLKRIAKYKKEIKDIGDDIYENPELGFEEYRTKKKIKEFLEDLNLEVEESIAITGLTVTIGDGSKGPTIAVLADMDALYYPEHPEANNKGAVHACGHNAQIAALLTTLIALNDKKILDKLQGSIKFILTPAEEFMNLEHREKLKEQGEISFLSGKKEMIKEGVFDDVDIVLASHSSLNEKNHIGIGGTNNGFLSKEYNFKGKASHAGGAPHLGRNALDSANISLNAINAWRQTFLEEDYIRVHPILTEGGTTVNVIPSIAQIETYIRAFDIEAIKKTASKIDAACKGGAMALGCNLIIDNKGGYLPFHSEGLINKTLKNNAEELEAIKTFDNGHFTGSSDLGDISMLKPCGIISMGGISGNPHTINFSYSNTDEAYILPGKVFALTIIDLLKNKADKADKVINSFKPKLTKEEYLKLTEELNSKEKHEYYNDI